MSNKLSIVIIAILILITGMMGTGFFVLWNKMSDLAISEINESSMEAGEEEGNGINIGPMFPLDTFIVNLADSASKRYLRVTMDLELGGENFTEELENRLPQIRNIILMTIPSKSVADLNNIEGKMALRNEITKKINELLNEEVIANLYFTEFVIQ